jgi:hypothetical protein
MGDVDIRSVADPQDCDPRARQGMTWLQTESVMISIMRWFANPVITR